MTENAFVIVQYYDALGLRARGSYPQEIRVRLAEVPALVTEIIRVVLARRSRRHACRSNHRCRPSTPSSRSHQCRTPAPLPSTPRTQKTF
jgi:hypothetical protein